MKSVPEIVIKSLHFELEETFHFILCNRLKGKKTKSWRRGDHAYEQKMKE